MASEMHPVMPAGAPALYAHSHMYFMQGHPIVAAFPIVQTRLLRNIVFVTTRTHVYRGQDSNRAQFWHRSLARGLHPTGRQSAIE